MTVDDAVASVGRSRRRRKEARPGEIMDAAMRVFAGKGFAAARIDDIAREAGVAKGTVYVYFESKDAVFEAVVREKVMARIAEVGDFAARFEGPTDALLETVLERIYADIVGSDLRHIMRLLIAEGPRFPHLVAFYEREALSLGIAVMRDVIRRGIERGEFREALAADLPQVVMGPAIMAAMWTMLFEEQRPLDLKRFLAAHIDLVLNGLRTRDPDS